MRTVVLIAGNPELRFRNEAEAAQTYSSVLTILRNLKSKDAHQSVATSAGSAQAPQHLSRRYKMKIPGFTILFLIAGSFSN
jgi:hypothetical protein